MRDHAQFPTGDPTDPRAFFPVITELRTRKAGTALALFGACGFFSCLHAQIDNYELAPIRYSETSANDPAAELVARIESGELKLDTSSDRAFLKDVLRELGVPIESQVLVYSKTSAQNERITPARPRAVYFSDDCYIGWVQNGMIEIIATDPTLGPIFYRMVIPRPKEKRALELERARSCLTCHGGTRTNNFPGMMVRSVRADGVGAPIFSAGTHFSDHASPLSERWGGWYVTGQAAGARHMGNLIFEETADGGAEVTEDFGVRLKSLGHIIDMDPYLAKTSDIVALMVMEHQVMVHNAITKAHFSTRTLLHRDKSLAKIDGRKDDRFSETTKRVLDSLANELLEKMLFEDELELEDWGVEGNDAFQEAFLAKAKRTGDGRSLRDFNLLSRLFKYRLSYMIHSKPFENLPPQFKKVFYRKLWDALHASSPDELGGHLKPKERERILAILLETKKNLPAYWIGGESGNS